MTFPAEGFAPATGTAEDRLTGTLTRLVRKTQREEQEQQPDMADVVFGFVDSVGLTTSMPPAAARVTFPCRLVSACVFEASEPALTSSVTIDFRFRVPPATAWTSITGGAGLSYALTTRADNDTLTGWQRFFDPGTELSAKLLSVSGAQSLTAALSMRKLLSTVPNAVQLFTQSGDTIVDQNGDTIGARRT